MSSITPPGASRVQEQVAFSSTQMRPPSSSLPGATDFLAPGPNPDNPLSWKEYFTSIPGWIAHAFSTFCMSITDWVCYGFHCVTCQVFAPSAPVRPVLAQSAPAGPVLFCVEEESIELSPEITPAERAKMEAELIEQARSILQGSLGYQKDTARDMPREGSLVGTSSYEDGVLAAYQRLLQAKSSGEIGTLYRNNALQRKHENQEQCTADMQSALHFLESPLHPPVTIDSNDTLTQEERQKQAHKAAEMLVWLQGLSPSRVKVERAKAELTAQARSILQGSLGNQKDTARDMPREGSLVGTSPYEDGVLAAYQRLLQAKSSGEIGTLYLNNALQREHENQEQCTADMQSALHFLESLLHPPVTIDSNDTLTPDARQAALKKMVEERQKLTPDERQAALEAMIQERQKQAHKAAEMLVWLQGLSPSRVKQAHLEDVSVMTEKLTEQARSLWSGLSKAESESLYKQRLQEMPFCMLEGLYRANGVQRGQSGAEEAIRQFMNSSLCGLICMTLNAKVQLLIVLQGVHPEHVAATIERLRKGYDEQQQRGTLIGALTWHACSEGRFQTESKDVSEAALKAYRALAAYQAELRAKSSIELASLYPRKETISKAIALMRNSHWFLELMRSEGFSGPSEQMQDEVKRMQDEIEQMRSEGFSEPSEQMQDEVKRMQDEVKQIQDKVKQMQDKVLSKCKEYLETLSWDALENEFALCKKLEPFVSGMQLVDFEALASGTPTLGMEAVIKKHLKQSSDTIIAQSKDSAPPPIEFWVHTVGYLPPMTKRVLDMADWTRVKAATSPQDTATREDHRTAEDCIADLVRHKRNYLELPRAPGAEEAAFREACLGMSLERLKDACQKEECVIDLMLYTREYSEQLDVQTFRKGWLSRPLEVLKNACQKEECIRDFIEYKRRYSELPEEKDVRAFREDCLGMSLERLKREYHIAALIRYKQNCFELSQPPAPTETKLPEAKDIHAFRQRCLAMEFTQLQREYQQLPRLPLRR